jgi:segregation and condensation protein B
LEQTDLMAAMEAILFACGEPLEASRLAEALSLGVAETKQLLAHYAEALDGQGRGFTLLRLGEQYQLATREQYIDLIRGILDKKRNAPLSQAAFEVLAIIAYNQPVTKAFVEQVRGVDCSGVISTLCQKNLIEEKGRLDLPGRPLVYCTTTNFLRCFSVSDLSELPRLPGGAGEDDALRDAKAMTEAFDQLTLEDLT